jgi:hypothetical protein
MRSHGRAREVVTGVASEGRAVRWRARRAIVRVGAAERARLVSLARASLD